MWRMSVTIATSIHAICVLWAVHSAYDPTTSRITASSPLCLGPATAVALPAKLAVLGPGIAKGLGRSLPFFCALVAAAHLHGRQASSNGVLKRRRADGGAMRHGQQEAARAADGQQEDELGEHGPSVLSRNLLLASAGFA